MLTEESILCAEEITSSMVLENYKNCVVYGIKRCMCDQKIIIKLAKEGNVIFLMVYIDDTIKTKRVKSPSL